MAGADLRQRFGHHGAVIENVVMAGIGNMQEQIGLPDLVQGRTERCHQPVGKMPDETHRIRQEHFPAVVGSRTRRLFVSSVANRRSST